MEEIEGGVWNTITTGMPHLAIWLIKGWLFPGVAIKKHKTWKPPKAEWYCSNNVAC